MGGTDLNERLATGGKIPDGGSLITVNVADIVRAEIERMCKAATLQTTKENMVANNSANAHALLGHLVIFRGRFAFNERDSSIWKRDRIPLLDEAGSYLHKGELSDVDFAAVLITLNRITGVDFGEARVRNAITTVAHENAYDPVRDYFESLIWDGKPRLRALLPCYFNTSGDKWDSEVGFRWMISAVARTYEPGCKADHMLILEGDQGLKKSWALKALVPDPSWHTDQLLKPDQGKDARIALRGKLLGEFSEMHVAKKSDEDAFKAFLTCEVDDYRAPFARTSQRYPRRLVFCGTTNRFEYLKDRTGNRRMWPVTITRTIDIKQIEQDRDQIWAEAVALYKAGEPWWLSDEFAQTAKDEQSDRVDTHLMETDILRAAERTLLMSPDGFALNEMLGSLYPLTEDRPRSIGELYALKRVIGDVLTGNGWRRQKVRVGEKTLRLWRPS